MTLVVLLSGVVPLTNFQAQVHSKVQIAFVSERNGNREIYVMDGRGKNLRNLTNHPATHGDPVWSPGSREIAFRRERDEQDGHHGKPAI